jgi:hypothetical protein
MLMLLQVGQVLNVKPSLQRVDVLCEVCTSVQHLGCEGQPAKANDKSYFWPKLLILCTCRDATWSLQVNDVSTVIPRNSVIEANQSGLIAEPLLDVTPQLPLPAWKAGPHEPGCSQEGAIVCENGRWVLVAMRRDHMLLNIQNVAAWKLVHNKPAYMSPGKYPAPNCAAGMQDRRAAGCGA